MELENVKLWSNLKIRPTTRTEIQCPNDLQVSTEEFFEALKQKLSDNRLPAMAELCEVKWDDSDKVQKRIIIKYNDANVASNIIRSLIGLDSIGNFSYIEEKVMIIPPTLPKKPEEVKQRGCLLSFVLSICGFIMVCISVLGEFFQIIGGLILIISIVFGIVLIARYTKLSQKEEEILNDSWKEWEKQVAEIIHMSNQDDIFGRFILAVSSTVEQVTKALFIDKQAAVINKNKEEWTQKQIEDELEKRRKEFK